MAWCYAGLAHTLPAEQPIFGVQSPALTEPSFAPATLAELAHRYLAEIRAIRPEGPYRLLGWSLGGRIAHTVATQLQSEGHVVDLLALVDSYPEINETEFRTNIRSAFATLGLAEHTLPPLENIGELSDAALAALTSILPQNLVVTEPDLVRNVYQNAMRTTQLVAGTTPNLFHGPVRFFRASNDTTHDAAGRTPMDWVPFVNGEITEYPIPATHDQMTDPEPLRRLAVHIGRILDTGTTITAPHPKSPLRGTGKGR